MSFLLRNHRQLWQPLRIASARFATSATESDPNRPIKYVGSPAYQLKSKQSRTGTFNYDDIPSYQTYAVVGSVAVFLIYFCVLREENDIDEELGKTLYERVPGMEQTQLLLVYKYNIENQLDNAAIVARMKELGMKIEDINV